jgi:HEAT repeat protein/beta-lactamase regulating signal transducer with metallopeptidase domain
VTVETNLLPFLLANTLKGTLLLGVAGLAAVQLRRSSAAARHLVWHIALLGVLALPLVSMVAPSWEVLPSVGLERFGWSRTPAVPVASSTLAGDVAAPVGAVPNAAQQGAVEPGPAAAGSSVGVLTQPTSAAAESAASRAGARLPIGAWLLYIWAAGAALVLARFLLGTLVVHWFTWRAGPVQATSWASLNETMSFAVGLGHPVKLLKSERAATPMTFGVLDPVVLLPHDADEWPEERRRVVLLHELAHVQRLDSLTNIFATLACALYWFNPLVWLAVRRLRAEGERACDDWVLRAGMRASTYAEHLLDMVKTIGRLHTPAAALPMAQRSTFEGRLLAILEPGMNRNGTRRGQAVLLTGVIALVVLPLAALTAPATAHSTLADDPAQTIDEQDSSPGVLQRIGAAIKGKSDKEPKEKDAGKPAEKEVEREVEQDRQRPAVMNPKALAALIGALGDENVEVRTASISALGKAQDPRAIAALSAALRGDKDASVRRAAAWALGQIEDERGVPALLDALRGDSDIEVRRNAAWALGQIESTSAVSGLGDALRATDKQLRETAVWALGQIGESEAIPALATALGDGDAGIRKQAAWALGQIGEEPAVAPLSAALRDSDADVRMNAVWGLGQVGEESAVDALLPLLGDANADVRDKVSWALGQIGSERAVTGLSRVVSDGNADVRTTAVWALGQIGDEAANPALATALKDSEPGIRKQAAWALGQVGDDNAPQALLDALKDENVEVRRTAAWALGQIEDPKSAAALRAALQDPDAQVKRTALRALARLGDDAAYEALSDLLKDPDPQVRREAAAALGGHGGWVDPRPQPRPQPRPAPRPRPNGW